MLPCIVFFSEKEKINSKTKFSNNLVITEYQKLEQSSERSNSKSEKGKYAAMINYSTRSKFLFIRRLAINIE